MPNLNEIKNRIVSIKNTKKITRAMYLISVSKSKKAKAQLIATRPYFNQVRETLFGIINSTGKNVMSPFLGHISHGRSKKKLVLVFSGDKGMAGGYNHNIIELLDNRVDKKNSTLLVAGYMGRQQIAKKNFDVDKNFSYSVMNPNVYRAREIAEKCVSLYLNEGYSEVYMVYTKMITPIKQEPDIIKILPLSADQFVMENSENKSKKNFVYEPNAIAVFDHLTPHYLKGIIYSALVEAFSSEQHARTYAMDNSTRSAEEMIAKLSLLHNRARQAKITQEINEIIGGIPTE